MRSIAKFVAWYAVVAIGLTALVAVLEVNERAGYLAIGIMVLILVIVGVRRLRIANVTRNDITRAIQAKVNEVQQALPALLGIGVMLLVFAGYASGAAKYADRCPRAFPREPPCASDGVCLRAVAVTLGDAVRTFGGHMRFMLWDGRCRGGVEPLHQ